MAGWDSSNEFGVVCTSVVVFGAAGAADVMLVGRDFAEGAGDDGDPLGGVASRWVDELESLASTGVGAPSRRDITSARISANVFRPGALLADPTPPAPISLPLPSSSRPLPLVATLFVFARLRSLSSSTFRLKLFHPALHFFIASFAVLLMACLSAARVFQVDKNEAELGGEAVSGDAARAAGAGELVDVARVSVAVDKDMETDGGLEMECVLLLDDVRARVPNSSAPVLAVSLSPMLDVAEENETS